MPHYLISYDVSSTRTRGRIAARLEKAGVRVQLSVFMVNCTENRYAGLVRDLLSCLDDSDSLLCLPCCEHCYARATITGEEPPLMYFG